MRGSGAPGDPPGGERKYAIRGIPRRREGWHSTSCRRSKTGKGKTVGTYGAGAIG